MSSDRTERDDPPSVTEDRRPSPGLLPAPPHSARRPVCSPEVAAALADGRPVVALETTIFSTLGLPRPANGEALERCEAVIRAEGAVPALTAVLDGVPRVGIGADEVPRILGGAAWPPARKVAERDLAVAIAQGWPFGATTVSASLALAAAAGIAVFATGGIGGVHRGASTTGDVSADLGALARHPVVCVCAGAKSFLDLPLTLEALETLSVPVLGFGTDTFPAFYVASSGLPVPHRVDEPAAVAAVHRARAVAERGTLVCVPIPAEAAIDAAEHDTAVATALAEADAAGASGPAATPFVLARLAAVTAGRSVPANLALAEHNARIAARIAVELGR